MTPEGLISDTRRASTTKAVRRRFPCKRHILFIFLIISSQTCGGAVQWLAGWTSDRKVGGLKTGLDRRVVSLDKKLCIPGTDDKILG